MFFSRKIGNWINLRLELYEVKIYVDSLSYGFLQVIINFNNFEV